MKEITVVIPNYNGKKYVIPCLRALFENTELEMDVIVVDNGSSDGSVCEVEKHYPEVKCIVLDKNYGFSKAVNVGIQEAKTPYVLLLNNDTKIKARFVESLLQTMKHDKKIFGVEAKMLQYSNHDKIDSAGTFYNALGWAFARGKDHDATEYTSGAETFAACAGAALYRKSVFTEIGYFEESYFAYLEDIDIGYRAKIHGYRNVYEPKALVYHVGSAVSGSRYNEFKVQISARNNVYLIYRNMPWIQIFINLPLLFIGFVIKGLFFAKKGFLKSYLSGFASGVKLCSHTEKPAFAKQKWFNYVKIQFELWINVLRKRW